MTKNKEAFEKYLSCFLTKVDIEDLIEFFGSIEEVEKFAHDIETDTLPLVNKLHILTLYCKIYMERQKEKEAKP